MRGSAIKLHCIVWQMCESGECVGRHLHKSGQRVGSMQKYSGAAERRERPGASSRGRYLRPFVFAERARSVHGRDAASDTYHDRRA
ncbi:hypothetical protein EVAR_102756_1 [Eumeta japonica]|uniref:Uncharacterized protein n=1 Tax=Eumeta variegata TaxID=151549 RepID=A0A4C1TIX8_EUMVA|nr:hypothetical protein EVAR_102756_1 [Eumeta japonica]